MKNNQKNNLDYIDQMIKKILNKYVSKEDVKQPLSLNVLLSEEFDESAYNDTEYFYEDDFLVTITLYVPFSINMLRFDVLSERKIAIKSFDYSYYKQFWLPSAIQKETISTSYKNNVLEISFFKKNGPVQI